MQSVAINNVGTSIVPSPNEFKRWKETTTSEIVTADQHGGAQLDLWENRGACLASGVDNIVQSVAHAGIFSEEFVII